MYYLDKHYYTTMQILDFLKIIGTGMFGSCVILPSQVDKPHKQSSMVSRAIYMYDVKQESLCNCKCNDNLKGHKILISICKFCEKMIFFYATISLS